MGAGKPPDAGMRQLPGEQTASQDRQEGGRKVSGCPLATMLGTAGEVAETGTGWESGCGQTEWETKPFRWQVHLIGMRRAVL